MFLLTKSPLKRGIVSHEIDTKGVCCCTPIKKSGVFVLLVVFAFALFYSFLRIDAFFSLFLNIILWQLMRSRNHLKIFIRWIYTHGFGEK